MDRIKTAVVIGGTSGLGRSIAEALAEAGVQVSVFGRSLPETALPPEAAAAKPIKRRTGRRERRGK